VPGLQRIGLTHTFPQPATLAAADLSGLGLSSTPQTAIRAFAQAVAEGAVPLDRSVSLDRLVGAIGELDGLGARTAHYLAFRLGEPDAWPMSGRDLRHVLAGNAQDARKDHRTHRAAAALPDRWRPWRALAAAHLWMANGWHQVLVAGTAPTEDKEQPRQG
jgi:3-methyladenine DNA glycosylase/8-oxoguanine DNA glycosylase